MTMRINFLAWAVVGALFFTVLIHHTMLSMKFSPGRSPAASSGVPQIEHSGGTRNEPEPDPMLSFAL